jgi:D-beta-D-heptose 7-phosphate kinase/D-beta-D-heptose 1-phosphate adenosyltransferase
VNTQFKILSASEALELRQNWRGEGKSVAFTNGCFDLLHPGHVRYLEVTKSKADFLIVGLNSDPSVRRLKGASRPVQGEDARAIVLAGLQSVDAVVVFEGDTPLELITLLQPDVLTKGADYDIEDVVGAKEVLSWGGKVELVALEKGHSTTNLIAKNNGEK